MALKIFGKGSAYESSSQQQEVGNETNQRIDKLESHLNELGGEVVRLRQEVNTLLARQNTFKMALRRLREYLEDRGQQDEVAEEVGASFQDIPHDSESEKNGDSGEMHTASKSKLH